MPSITSSEGAHRFPLGLHLFGLQLVLLAVCLAPWVGKIAWTSSLGILLLTYGSAALGLNSWIDRLSAKIQQSTRALNILLLLSAPLTTLAFIELSTRGLEGIGLIEDRPPMQTLLPNGTEDWRQAHITADRFREADPKLLWRPVATAPYSSQRFKGPEVTLDKPDGTFRIMAYGDSNTDGPDQGSWPEEVGRILGAHKPNAEINIEVLNAGVVGYSSYQGLLRFREEAGTYQPDLVLVSFGWNDSATTAGVSDKDYSVPSPSRVRLVRTLLQYHFYRAARTWFSRQPQAALTTLVPRVSVDQYRDNLKSFSREAEMRGIDIVFLTRPHRETRRELTHKRKNWRSRVPSYNQELRRFAQRKSKPMIDIRKAFSDRQELFTDECHFTLEGHREMAAVVVAALSQHQLLPNGL